MGLYEHRTIIFFAFIGILMLAAAQVTWYTDEDLITGYVTAEGSCNYIEAQLKSKDPSLSAFSLCGCALEASNMGLTGGGGPEIPVFDTGEKWYSYISSWEQSNNKIIYIPGADKNNWKDKCNSANLAKNVNGVIYLGSEAKAIVKIFQGIIYSDTTANYAQQGAITNYESVANQVDIRSGFYDEKAAPIKPKYSPPNEQSFFYKIVNLPKGFIIDNSLSSLNPAETTAIINLKSITSTNDAANVNLVKLTSPTLYNFITDSITYTLTFNFDGRYSVTKTFTVSKSNFEDNAVANTTQTNQVSDCDGFENWPNYWTGNNALMAAPLENNKVAFAKCACDEYKKTMELAGKETVANKKTELETKAKSYLSLITQHNLDMPAECGSLNTQDAKQSPGASGAIIKDSSGKEIGTTLESGKVYTFLPKSQTGKCTLYVFSTSDPNGVYSNGGTYLNGVNKVDCNSASFTWTAQLTSEKEVYLDSITYKADSDEWESSSKTKLIISGQSQKTEVPQKLTEIPKDNKGPIEIGGKNYVWDSGQGKYVESNKLQEAQITEGEYIFSDSKGNTIKCVYSKEKGWEPKECAQIYEIAKNFGKEWKIDKSPKVTSDKQDSKIKEAQIILRSIIDSENNAAIELEKYNNAKTEQAKINAYRKIIEYKLNSIEKKKLIDEMLK